MPQDLTATARQNIEVQKKLDTPEKRAIEVREAYEKEPKQQSTWEKMKSVPGKFVDSVMKDIDTKNYGAAATKGILALGATWLAAEIVKPLFSGLKDIFDWGKEKIFGIASESKDSLLKSALKLIVPAGILGSLTAVFSASDLSIDKVLKFATSPMELAKYLWEEGKKGSLDLSDDVMAWIKEQMGDATDSAKEKGEEVKAAVLETDLGKQAKELWNDPEVRSVASEVVDFMRDTANSLKGDALEEFYEFFPHFKDSDFSLDFFVEYSPLGLLKSLLEMGIGEEKLKDWAKQGVDAFYFGLAGVFAYKFLRGGNFARLGILSFLAYGLYKKYPEVFNPAKDIAALGTEVMDDVVDSYDDDPKMQDLLKRMNWLDEEWREEFMKHCQENDYAWYIEGGKIALITVGNVISWSVINVGDGLSEAFLNVPKLLMDDEYSGLDYVSDYYQNGGGALLVAGGGIGMLQALISKNRKFIFSIPMGAAKGALFPVYVGGKLVWNTVVALTKKELPHTAIKREIWSNTKHYTNSGKRIYYQTRAMLSKNPRFHELTRISHEIADLNHLMAQINSSHAWKDYDKLLKDLDFDASEFQSRTSNGLIKEIEAKIKTLQTKRTSIQMKQVRINVEAGKESAKFQGKTSSKQKGDNIVEVDFQNKNKTETSKVEIKGKVKMPKLKGAAKVVGAVAAVAGAGTVIANEVQENLEESKRREVAKEKDLTVEQFAAEVEKVNAEIHISFRELEEAFPQNVSDDWTDQLWSSFSAEKQKYAEKVEAFLSVYGKHSKELKATLETHPKLAEEYLGKSERFSLLDLPESKISQITALSGNDILNIRRNQKKEIEFAHIEESDLRSYLLEGPEADEAMLMIIPRILPVTGEALDFRDAAQHGVRGNYWEMTKSVAWGAAGIGLLFFTAGIGNIIARIGKNTSKILKLLPRVSPKVKAMLAQALAKLPKSIQENEKVKRLIEATTVNIGQSGVGVADVLNTFSKTSTVIAR